MDVWLRVLTAVLLVLAPSVLFVLFYRGMIRMQDRELIARLAEAGHIDPASLRTLDGSGRTERDERRPGQHGRNANADRRRAQFLREQKSRSQSGATPTRHEKRGEPTEPNATARRAVRCGHCGAVNAATFGRCWNCVERFE